jgi:hypothetical protein
LAVQWFAVPVKLSPNWDHYTFPLMHDAVNEYSSKSLVHGNGIIRRREAEHLVKRQLSDFFDFLGHRGKYSTRHIGEFHSSPNNTFLSFPRQWMESTG